MTRAILAAVLVLAAMPALAQQTRHYSPNGNSLGTTTHISPNSQRHYDARGHSLGTSTRIGNTTTHYDARGNVTGRETRR